MLEECDSTYAAMEGEFKQVSASCRRAREGAKCTKKKKDEVEFRCETFVKAVVEFSDAAFDWFQWMSKQCRKEDIIRKMDEDRITMRGKVRKVRQDREEVCTCQRSSKKKRNREKKSWNTLKRRRRKRKNCWKRSQNHTSTF